MLYTVERRETRGFQRALTFGAGLGRAAPMELELPDDAADCLRYLVATKTREIRVRKLRGL